MALKGLALTTYLGWFIGLVFLKRPWGKPTFTSWFSFSTFNGLFWLGAYCVTLVDFLINNPEGLYEQGDNNVFAVWVRAISLLEVIITTLLKRLAFLLNAKKIGKVMEILHNYKGFAESKRKKNCGRCNIPWVQLIIYSTFVLSIVSTLLRAITWVQENAHRPSWFKVTGVWGFSIIYYLFAILPIPIVTNSTYVILTVLQLKVAKVYCDFCQEVRNALPKLALNDYQPQPMEIFRVLNVSTKYTDSRNKIRPLGTSAADIISKSSRISRQDVINQFEEMKELMKLTNEALSSLLLWMVTSVTLGLVTTASQLFVFGLGFHAIPDIMFLFLVLVYSLLLQTGHKIVEMQRNEKVLLYRQFLDLPWTPGKLEMEDVILEILEYEWKLSASGFFSLDRRLASGIFSLVLNYVVIFVQLNIALKDSGTQTSNCTGLNATFTSTTTMHPLVSTSLPL